jgi:hypothetical protein
MPNSAGNLPFQTNCNTSAPMAVAIVIVSSVLPESTRIICANRCSFFRQDGKLRASFLTETMCNWYLIQISCFYKFSWLPPTLLYVFYTSLITTRAIILPDYLRSYKAAAAIKPFPIVIGFSSKSLLNNHVWKRTNKFFLEIGISTNTYFSLIVTIYLGT